MPQSLSKVILHIIFSTKDREAWLDSDVRMRMHAYLATICCDLGVELVHVGGMADHIHIVTTLPRTLSQAQLVEQIKKTSSKWIKTLDARYRGFARPRCAIGARSGSMLIFPGLPTMSRPGMPFPPQNVDRADPDGQALPNTSCNDASESIL